ncbi:hypothetical protein LX32DRAFT_30013 [Colletotrichum zoysiae]|uniref:Uncharacterized protein n=1 Tax=Colletotrichum zoysiae TaxID=1216348 RepID=A0AAD9HDG9_9PEZI|nr:hypothetical protein LX32DRAFT_30013 [Colletotrichum zoysiae]
MSLGCMATERLGTLTSLASSLLSSLSPHLSAFRIRTHAPAQCPPPQSPTVPVCIAVFRFYAICLLHLHSSCWPPRQGDSAFGACKDARTGLSGGRRQGERGRKEHQDRKAFAVCSVGVSLSGRFR